MKLKMSYKPAATSTPKTIRGRPPIRTSQCLQSPIDKKCIPSESEESDLSDKENNEGLVEFKNNKANKEESEKFKSKSENKESLFKNEKEISYFKQDRSSVIGFLLIFILLFFYGFGTFFYNTDVKAVKSSAISIENLRSKFPAQEEEFWLTIQVAVDEIIRSNQPKSIIFLHKDETYLKNMLQSISDYASEKIFSNLTEPLVVTDKDLSRQDLIEDYGIFISELKEKLSEHAVVIVRNLDKVPGTVAQAFHSLCDEYNPVKENVLYLFTIKVDKFQNLTKRFVENILKKYWSDLNSDKFYPLYTRISSFLLKIS